ncbi:HNH endonuclease [Neoaquamicrobium sediminum]|uniref:HNH endonuclease n=1 Tax=Neoaquamicrobium sediminum TaxID=1849104 RepID=UPI003BA9E439
MADKSSHYYEARGFSIYYFANAVFNVVKDAGAYLRGIEEILGDMQVLNLMRPFHKFTNLHYFLEAIVREIIEEEMERRDENDPRFLIAFLQTYKIPFAAKNLADEEGFYTFVSESHAYHTAMDDLVDEVFHVFFNDVGFLQSFNELCARYIDGAGFGQEFMTQAGTLKRVPIPAWARRAIFHRDKGECRECKRSLAMVINRLETERYDHIVPLARYGANDLTNLQLLCEPCNLKKAAGVQPVSPFYPRAFGL